MAKKIFNLRTIDGNPVDIIVEDDGTVSIHGSDHTSSVPTAAAPAAASTIPYTPGGGMDDLAATDTQAAIDELLARVIAVE